MDTLIIFTIGAALLALWFCPGRRIGVILFWIALVASILLFQHHVTDPLPLNF